MYFPKYGKYGSKLAPEIQKWVCEVSSLMGQPNSVAGDAACPSSNVTRYSSKDRRVVPPLAARRLHVARCYEHARTYSGPAAHCWQGFCTLRVGFLGAVDFPLCLTNLRARQTLRVTPELMG